MAEKAAASKDKAKKFDTSRWIMPVGPKPPTMEDRLRHMDKVGKEATSSVEAARAFLHSTGMYTPAGKLKKEWRPESVPE